MSEASELHNKIAVEFVQKTIRSLIAADATQEDLLIVFETMALAILMTLSNYYKVSPQDATVYVEEVLHEALKRFTAIQSQRGT